MRDALGVVVVVLVEWASEFVRSSGMILLDLPLVLETTIRLLHLNVVWVAVC